MTDRAYYVAPGGDDDNPGDSPARPLRTMAEAERRGWDTHDSVTIHLAEGRYDPRDVYGDDVDCVAFGPPRCSSRLPRVGQSRDERRRCLVRGEP